LPELQITLFADFTSPASYLTEAALWRRAGAGGVTLLCRAFEEEAESAEPESGIGALAAALGLPLRPPTTRPRTGKAHEAARLAREKGGEEAFRGAVYRAYWGEGQDIGRIDVLQALAAQVGLDAFEMKVALDIDRFRDEVRRDTAVGLKLGVRRLPVLFLGTGPGARILIGPQTPETLEAAISHFIAS
jgi:predicted DsbA family dithiol-disulfide isomerase